MNKTLLVLASALLLTLAAEAAKPAPKPAPKPAAPAPLKNQDRAGVTKALTKANWTPFLAACKADHVDENCQFLHSVADYKASPVKTKGVMAEKIMNYYIGPKSSNQVNISGTQVTETEKAYAAAKKAKKYENNLFGVADTEVMKMFVEGLTVSKPPNVTKMLSAMK